MVFPAEEGIAARHFFVIWLRRQYATLSLGRLETKFRYPGFAFTGDFFYQRP